jgi:hypothetical protein
VEGYRDQDVSAAVRGDTVFLSGSLFAPGVYEDANEYDWADLEVPADEFAEALCRASAGVPWQRGPARVTQQQVSVGTDSIYAPGRAAADLTGDRMALLVLDSCEVAFASGKEARTGTMLPKGSLDSAFLTALRSTPDLVGRMSQLGLERTVLGLLNEASQAPVTLTPVVADAGLWLARTEGDDRDAMLVSVLGTESGSVDISVVDRVNGVRDRKLLGKAVIVTRSSFSAEVSDAYGGLSHRLELVDFDRLTGVLADAGWISREPGFLMSPVRDKPRQKVFISYSWMEHDFAVWLYNRLHGWSYSCFLDRVDLLPGQVILSAVKQAIAGADVVLLCCSKSSLASPWVQAEIKHCLAREKTEGRTILVPIKLGDVRFAGAFEVLNERLAADFTGEHRGRRDEALGKVRETIDRLLVHSAS